MASTKEIKRRIKSISSTKKITKAMEMVSAAKMRRAIESVLRTRTYANLSWETILNLSARMGENNSHPLLTKRDNIKHVAVILITSNRGMCAGFNANVVNKVHESVKKHLTTEVCAGEACETVDQKHDFILLGKKGVMVDIYYKYNIVAEFPKADAGVEIGEVIPVAKLVTDDFLSGKYDKILVAYTDFVNAVKQIPRVKQLLPIDISTQDEFLGVVGKSSRIGVGRQLMEEKSGKHLSDEKYEYEYTFEPSPKEVLDEMIPRLIEIQLFQALLESNASEHSARMAAMHQATQAAGDLVGELTLSYNKARQAGITNEIAEITSGANAMGE